MEEGSRMVQRRLLALVVGAMVIVGACSSSSGSSAPTAAASAPPAASQPAATAAGSAPASQAAATTAPNVPTELGSTQGQTINVLNWPGYVENGSTYKEYDWVTPFEKQSGCKVKPQSFGTSDEAYTLYSTNP